MDGNPPVSDEYAAHPAMTDGIEALGPQRKVPVLRGTRWLLSS